MLYGLTVVGRTFHSTPGRKLAISFTVILNLCRIVPVARFRVTFHCA